MGWEILPARAKIALLESCLLQALRGLRKIHKNDDARIEFNSEDFWKAAKFLEEKVVDVYPFREYAAESIPELNESGETVD